MIPSLEDDHRRERAMMGCHDTGQQLFYSFDLDEVVPVDHMMRDIDRVLDLSWVRRELAPHLQRAVLR